jgi:hypothetical protein
MGGSLVGGAHVERQAVDLFHDTPLSAWYRRAPDIPHFPGGASKFGLAEPPGAQWLG